MGLLDGRRLLITGVLTDRSIAFAVARRAQEEGAEIVLTGFGRGMRLTQRMAGRLPQPADVLELDATDESHVAAVRAALEERWGALDGVLHAIAFVPGDALGGRFLEAPAQSAIAAFEISAFSLKTVAAGLAPLLERGEHAGVVGLDFDARVAWPAYDWAGVSKAAL
ncbi:MAG: SDR family oxidoreductase, partial [Solirubrobacterales bacterium]|nr:SDR family oxidoreductase [Solirubrobacterales bacterium]